MNILVVDDDVELVGLLRFALANAGYDVATAFDGPQALARFHASAPELVVLGTGARQVFPPPAILAAFLTRGLGVEVMTNDAAARTYSVLAGEGRRVVAAFVIRQPLPQ